MKQRRFELSVQGAFIFYLYFTDSDTLLWRRGVYLLPRERGLLMGDELFFNYDEHIKEECGVFGILNPDGENVEKSIYYG